MNMFKHGLNVYLFICFYKSVKKNPKSKKGNGFWTFSQVYEMSIFQNLKYFWENMLRKMNCYHNALKIKKCEKKRYDEKYYFCLRLKLLYAKMLQNVAEFYAKKRNLFRK